MNARALKILAVSLCLCAAGNLVAQVPLQRLKSFVIAAQSAADPLAKVIQGRDGALYGTTLIAGTTETGTAFKLSTNGTGFMVLHTFTGLNGDGQELGWALVQGSDAMLYGTTRLGGSYDGGTVFKMNTNGSGYQVIFSFGDGNPEYPASALVQGSDGELYGNTSSTVFKMDTNGNNFKVLHVFTGSGGDGETPAAALVQGSDGALYGTTEGGGTGGEGTVFTVQTNGSNYMVLHPFTGDNGDGASPVAALIQGNDGALYGTTEDGGSNQIGAIFKLDTNGSNYMTLYSFTYVNEGYPVGIVYPDGWYPEAALVQGSDGALYGTTAGGEANTENGAGTLFRLNTDGSDFTNLYSFTTPYTISSFGTNVDGAMPVASLIQGADGSFYGTAELGGNAFGTVFKFNTNGSVFTTLTAFSDTGGDGVTPTCALVQGSNGTLYGATSEGGYDGTTGAGTVFKLNPDGSGYTILVNLPPSLDTGTTAGNAVNVILGNDGVLYGTAEFNGGANQGEMDNQGEVFKLNTDGSGFMVLHPFAGGAAGDGSYPVAPLVQGSDGMLYGTTEQGGDSGYGTVFKLDTNGGSYQVIYDLSVEPATNGGLPTAALIQGSDGMLYGTTTDYGTNNYGTAFKLTTNGDDFTVIHAFGAGEDGEEPQAALVQGKDGFLYGTTPYGGTNEQGMVFKVSTDGSVYADLYDFSGFSPDTSGAAPYAPLIQGNDGALYGSATEGGGGGDGDGTVFKLGTNGSNFTVLYTFPPPYTNGVGPVAALLQGKNGAFYGMSKTGGDFGYGTIFALQLPALYISQSGGTVTVFWQNVPGWILQQDANLTTPAGWSDSSGVITSNGTNYLNITPPEGNSFFRLFDP
jgi:uncharacterized repeat protein (TIGR03803 family)